MNRPVPVSLAFITNAKQHVLITERGEKSDMPGYWEFPGGKVEPNETPEQALKRELYEELGITIDHPQFVTEMLHSYSHKTVLLYVYHVKAYSGLPHCCEAQQGMRWVGLEALAQYQLLEAGFRLIPFLATQLNASYESYHEV